MSKSWLTSQKHELSHHLVFQMGSSLGKKRVSVPQLPSPLWFSVSPDHLDPDRAMLALFSHPDPAQAWKLAYFYCLSNSKHFLEQILVSQTQWFSITQVPWGSLQASPCLISLPLIYATQSGSISREPFVFCPSHSSRRLREPVPFRLRTAGVLYQSLGRLWNVRSV